MSADQSRKDALAKDGYFCVRCSRPMRRSSWGGWFEHVRETNCESQHAEWCERE